MRNLVKDSKGAAALEFAFILPVLLILATEAMQFGWSLYVNHSLLDAVRSTTRSVSVGEIELADVTVATVLSRMGINISGLTVTSTATPVASPNLVTISASIPRTNVSVIDILGLFGSGQLTSSVTMRLE